MKHLVKHRLIIIKIVAVAEIVAGMPVVIPDVVPAIVDAAVAATVVVATVVAATANIKAERTSRLGLGNPHVNQPQADHDGKCECDFLHLFFSPVCAGQKAERSIGRLCSKPGLMD